MPRDGYVEGYVPGRNIREVRRVSADCSGDGEAANIVRHPSTNNTFVEGYIPSEIIREIQQEVCVVISNPIVVNQVIRPIGVNYVQPLTPLNTAADGDLASNTAISQSPTPNTHLIIFVNGRMVVPADGPGDVANAAAWVESPGGVIRARGAAQIGDLIKWNGSVAGMELVDTDELVLIYEVDPL